MGHEYNIDYWRWEEGDSDEEAKNRKIPSKGFGGLHANNYPAADDDDEDEDDDALWAKEGHDLDFSDAGLNKRDPGEAMEVDSLNLSTSSFCRRRASTSHDQGNQMRNSIRGDNLIPPMAFSSRASSAQGRPLSTRASPSYDQGNKQRSPPISSGSNHHNPSNVDKEDSPHAMDGDDDDDDETDEYAKEFQLALYEQSLLDDDEFERNMQLAINQSLQTSDRPDLKQKGVCKSDPLKKLDSHCFKEELKRFGMGASGNRGEPMASLCVICGDDKSTGNMKKGPNCSHFFCPGCINAYVWEKMEGQIENMESTTAKCPHKDCREILSAKQCREFLITPELLKGYVQNENRLTRLLAVPKYFKCPFEDCSRPILDDELCFKIRACSFCSRIFCMICKRPWHLGLTCAESRNLIEEQRRKERLLAYMMELRKNLGVEDLYFSGPRNLLD
ncbi:OLC1v1038445C1 [Oldenlandia corymbosa var. corymbosa]|uniref:RBR-type E3 ubiquitin transferase n=1 Tax=Oldenlandia corymbosa var. corymbosa TaxID=529605 RepID=A0AAV1D0Y3_OLDCO|nr:OLC1v1038445C1 [Oldenlandia corymbosa var. corymbosa]